MAKDKARRFNLHFNLSKEDEAFAANILDGMGRKKTALVTKAILYLYQTDASEIDKIKRYDFSKTSDLMFRGALNAGVMPTIGETPEKKVLQEEKKEIKEEKKPFIEKTKEIPVEEKSEEKIEEPIVENKQEERSDEDDEILSDMLDSLSDFM